MLVNPYKWMSENKGDVYELSTRNSDKFDQLYQEKLIKFGAILDQKEKQAVERLMQKSVIIGNFCREVA